MAMIYDDFTMHAKAARLAAATRAETALMLAVRRVLLGAIAGSMSMVAPMAWGADAAAIETGANAESASSRAKVATLEEVIVSAQRRDQKLQDVPLAVSVVTEDAVRKLSADSFADVARTIPGVSFSQLGPGRQKVAIRGINANTGGATVAYYIDDTPLPATRGTVSFTQTDLRTFDVERVEVLRGPQGTLYGARALGGAIRVIPNRPDSSGFEALAEVTGTLTRDGGPGVSLNGMVNLPLVEDVLAARVVAYMRDRDGFIDRKVPISDRRYASPGAATQFNSLSYGKENIAAEHTVGMRAVLEWTPTPWLSVRPSVMYQETRLDGMQDITGGAANPKEDLVQLFLADVAEPSREQWTLSNLTLQASLGWANLVSSTSLFERKNAFVEEATAELDQDGFFLEDGPILPHSIEEGSRDRSFIQELRLASADDGRRLSWLAGLYYSDRDGDRYITETLPGYSAVYGPLGGPVIPNDDFFSIQSAPDTETEKAAFGELGLRVLDPLTLTVGVRHYRIKNGQPEGGTTATGIYGDTELPEPEPAFSQEFRGEQYRFNAAWDFGSDRMVYVQAAQGFRPGFSRGGVQPAFVNNPLCRPQLEQLGLLPFPDKVDSDELWNYELGAKVSAFGGSTAFNAAMFQIDWDRIPQLLFLDCGQFFTANAGSARSRGIELEMASALTDRLSVSVSASYIDATLQKDAPQFGAKAGDRLQEVPRWQAAVAGSYTFRALDRFDGTLHLDVQYTGASSFGFDADDPELRKPATTLVNARLDFAAATDWTVSLFARNIFNDIQRQGLATSLSVPIEGRPRYIVNQPFTVGLSVRRHFD